MSPVDSGLAPLEGMTFVVVGPLLVADLTQVNANKLEVGPHGMEAVGGGQHTESHNHNFLSLYRAKGLDVVCDGRRFPLPEKALTLIPPGINHSWVPQGKGGAVGSIDHRHEQQKVVA